MIAECTVCIVVMLCLLFKMCHELEEADVASGATTWCQKWYPARIAPLHWKSHILDVNMCTSKPANMALHA